jgi:signal peptidase II
MLLRRHDGLAAHHAMSMKSFFSVLPLYALDQATKWWVVHNIEIRFDQRPVVPGFFYICYWGNTGAAFGMFKDNNLPLIVLSLAALIGLVIFHLRGAFVDALSQWGAALLVAGILGNVTDRLVRTHVVDFLLFDLHVPGANPWPAFNIADSCICIAAALFVFGSFRGQKAARSSTALD